MKKLLKYDLKAIARIWWMMAIGVGVLSIVGAIAFRFFLENIENDEFVFLTIIAAFAAFFSIFVIIVSMAATMFLVYARFYKNLFTDEGYLTFTLPVKRSEIFLSKTLNAVIWTFAHSILIVFAICVFLLISPPTNGSGIFNTVAFEWFGELFALLSDGGFSALLSVIAVLLIIASYLLFSTTLTHLCITVASIIAKKAKIAMAILIYYLVSSVLGVVFQIVGVMATTVIGLGLTEITSNMSESAQGAIIVLVLFLIFAIISTLAIILYAATQHLIERKLNLS